MVLHREAPRSSSGKNQRSTKPDRGVQGHIMGGRITLDELFVNGRGEADEGQFLAEIRLAARCRLIGVFVHAIDSRDKKGVDKCIIGCGGSVKELVQYAIVHMQHAHGFVRYSQLPAQYSRLNNHWRDMVRDRARMMLLTETLVGTQPGWSAHPIDGVFRETVWYDETYGIWRADQSLLDEYGEIRAKIGEVVAPKQCYTKRKG